MRALLHLLRYRLGLDRANTQTTALERDCIARFAGNSHRAVEIGVYEGVTTGTIAGSLPSDAVLYAIDPFIAGRVGICWGKAIAKRESKRHAPTCEIVFIEEFSHIAAQKLDGTFDFVFVDGDHSWDGIVRDWSDWSARIDQGGVIALHDTLVPSHNPNVSELGSHKYFMEHIRNDQRFEIVEQVDSLSVLRRLQHNGTAPGTP